MNFFRLYDDKASLLVIDRRPTDATWSWTKSVLNVPTINVIHHSSHLLLPIKICEKQEKKKQILGKLVASPT